MINKLTEAQTKVFNFIKSFIHEKRYPPTREEIRKEFGYRSINAVQDHLKYLAKKGAIRLDHNISRGIVIVEN